MLFVSLLLLATAGVLVVAGIVSSNMALLWVAIGMTLAAAVGLAVGVARNRPRRRMTAPVATTWSGAAAEPAESLADDSADEPTADEPTADESEMPGGGRSGLG